VDCLDSSDLLARVIGAVSDIVSDTAIGGGQSGRPGLASVIEVSDKGARTDGTSAQVSATVADVLVPGRCGVRRRSEGAVSDTLSRFGDRVGHQPCIDRVSDSPRRCRTGWRTRVRQVHQRVRAPCRVLP
jgi:hypothetical protein